MGAVDSEELGICCTCVLQTLENADLLLDTVPMFKRLFLLPLLQSDDLDCDQLRGVDVNCLINDPEATATKLASLFEPRLLGGVVGLGQTGARSYLGHSLAGCGRSSGPRKYVVPKLRSCGGHPCSGGSVAQALHVPDDLEFQHIAFVTETEKCGKIGLNDYRVVTIGIVDLAHSWARDPCTGLGQVSQRGDLGCRVKPK